MQVEVSIYDLGGRLVQQLVAQTRGQGRYVERWDSRGSLVWSHRGCIWRAWRWTPIWATFEQTRTMAVAY